MAFDWETYRSEICDLYHVQGKPMRQVVEFMRDTYGLHARERTYWKKIKDWGAQKHAPTRQAQRATQQSFDSGYQSQNFPSSWSTNSRYSQLADDSSSVLSSPTLSDEQSSHYAFRPLTGQLSASQSLLASPAISEQDPENGPCRHRRLSSKEASSDGHDLPSARPPSSSIRTCVGFSHLSSLECCQPHALPSQCPAAHTKMELLCQGNGAFLCEHCYATKLHHLACVARNMDVGNFKRELLVYQYLLGHLDKDGNSCVHFAAGSGASLNHLKVLASEGAPMEHANYDDQTFLHVLNTKLYSPDTLTPIIQWALLTKGAMTRQDSHQRTVWHAIFQRGVTLDIFRSILRDLERNRDDMMIPDSENHTPLDCLKSYWTQAKELEAVDYLNMLQATGKLPGYAVNRTLTLEDIPDEDETSFPPRSSSISPATIARKGHTRHMPIRTTLRGHEPGNPPTHGVGEFVSDYRNGRAPDFTALLPRDASSLDGWWSPVFTPLPKDVPEKARRLLGS